jgi:hypothetical protein
MNLECCDRERSTTHHRRMTILRINQHTEVGDARWLSGKQTGAAERITHPHCPAEDRRGPVE